MQEDRVTAFGGVVGRVLRDATSFGTAVTAFILGAVVLTVTFIFTFIGNRPLAQILVQIVVAIALARFALNGLSGEFRGTILSTAGGSWGLAVVVAFRYLALNLIAIVPLLLMLYFSFTGALAQATAMHAAGGGAFAAAPGGDPSGGLGTADPSSGYAPPAAPAGGLALAMPILSVFTSKTVIASFVMLLMAFTLLPPIFLIVAVRAESFGAIFSKEVWLSTFRGRFADLYVIYSIHAGGVGMMIILAVPVVLFGFSAEFEFGVLFGIVAFGYMGALAITLLGRLCGFFAFGEEEAGPGLRLAPAPGGGFAAPPVATGFTPRVVHGGGAAAPVPVAGTTHEAGMEAHADAAAEPADDSGRPPLLDGETRAAAARAQFATDRDAALGELITLRDRHAPNGHVMHALALCLHEAGRADEALETAKAAIPLCLGRGQVALAADIFAAHWKQASKLGLDHEQIDAVAASLLKKNELTKAVAAYGLALTMDPTDRKAVKGLLQAADQRLHKDGRPKDAARIYTFLLQYAASSPFADDMKRGLAEAEARLARAS